MKELVQPSDEKRYNEFNTAWVDLTF